MTYNALIVGAGFSGAVLAERLASQLNWQVMVLEQQSHVGGQCYDRYDEHGILIHQYGPHLFHTNNQKVWDYLSQFTDWIPYQHQVLASINGKLVPIPFNLNSIECCFNHSTAARMCRALIARFDEGQRVPILKLCEEPDPLLQELAAFIYQKVFLNYTIKQWGGRPEDISPQVTARVPVVVSRDNRYFTDFYQAIPEQGYTAIINRLLAHPNITLRLSTPMSSRVRLDPICGALKLDGQPYAGLLIFTGMIDELFEYALGALPYRSLRFEFSHHDCARYQPVTTVNYPNEHAFTRITEFKHLGPQTCVGTTIVEEYPIAYQRNVPLTNIPCYPVLTTQSQQAYQGYAKMLSKHPRVIALGRLAQYCYFDMDDAVANALKIFESIQADTVFWR